ncbi:MAG: hypothetical protein ACFCVG_11280 [Kineosporiaceae bacterium]
MAIGAVSEVMAGPGGSAALLAPAAPGSVVVRSAVEPSSPAPVGASQREPVALDTALVDTMVQGATVVAAAEAAGLAAVAGLVLGRQGAARADLLAWRREHPDHRIARQAWDVAAADCHDSVADEVADEVSAALRMSRRIVEALTPVHAQDPALAAVVEAEILTRAPEQTPAQVSASARRAVLRHAHRIAQDATEQAHTGRRVGIEPASDPAGRDAGQAGLWVTGRADRVQAAFDTLTRAARTHLDTHPQERRTLDQVRADLALTALLTDLRTGRLRTDHDHTHHSPPDDGADPTEVPDPPVTVHLVLPLSTLNGGDEPAELLGHGPLPAPLARDLLLRTERARQSAWRGEDAPEASLPRHEHPVTVLLREDVTFTRWLTDPRGAVVSTPATAYRPPAGVARTARARDLTCRFPGCRTPAHRCDLDHTVPWPGGKTSPANLATVCRGHHEGKTKGRWGVALDPDTAALTWTAPTGHTYTTHPPAWPEGP